MIRAEKHQIPSLSIREIPDSIIRTAKILLILGFISGCSLPSFNQALDTRIGKIATLKEGRLIVISSTCYLAPGIGGTGVVTKVETNGVLKVHPYGTSPDCQVGVPATDVTLTSP